MVADDNEHGSVAGDSMDGVPMEISEEESANELPALPTPVSGPVLPPSISTPSAEKIARLQRMEHLRSEIARLSSKSRRTSAASSSKPLEEGKAPEHKGSGRFALDTDDTLIEVMEDSQQLCHAGGSQELRTPTPPPLVRRLFPEDDAVVDLNTPAPKPDVEIPVRPVARPLAALKAHFAENAAKKRAEKEAKRSKAESDEHKVSSGDKGSHEGSHDDKASDDKGSHGRSPDNKGSSHDKGSHDINKDSKEHKGWDDEKGALPVVAAGGDGPFLSRRQQLELQPKAKAKGKAKAKSAASKPSTEAPVKEVPPVAAESVKPDDEPVADIKDHQKDAVSRGRGRGKGRGRGRGRAASKADGDATSSPRAAQSKRCTDNDEETAARGAEPAGIAAAGEVDASSKRRKGEITQAAKPKAEPKKKSSSGPQSLSVLSGSKLPRQVSSCKKGMMPEDIMNLLQTDDLMMRIVLEQIEALEKPLESVPTKENQDNLPSYDWWKLSTYWTRQSVGVIRKGSG
ncbi:hypothetical protein AK812_SmicGene47251, partial [Symbiodinium microadriaticum]